MMKNNAPIKETVILTVGEIIVSAFVVLGYFLSDLIFETGFTYRIFTGVLLGSAVTVLNFFFLSLSVNRAVDRYIAIRGTKEMTEEEAERFTAEHSMAIQNSVKTSYIIRTVTMLATLVLAFLLDWFAPLATAIPLLAFRPILMAGEMIRRKFDKAPNPDNFIYYDDVTELADDEGEPESSPAESEESYTKESED